MKPAVILIGPQLGENIGTVARAMLNFGLEDLRLVNPRHGWDVDRAIKASAGADKVVENRKLKLNIFKKYSILKDNNLGGRLPSCLPVKNN